MGAIEVATERRVDALDLGDEHEPLIELALRLARLLDQVDVERSPAQLSKEFRAVLADLEAVGRADDGEEGVRGDLARFTAR